jgi:hypothetical protein
MTPKETAIEYPRELIAYERARARWKWEDIGKIVLIRGEEVIGVFHDLAAAREEARQRFGLERVLLKQIGAPEAFAHLGSALDSGNALRPNGETAPHGEEAEVYFARELPTYERHRAELEHRCLGQFALIYGDQIVGVFREWAEASEQGCRRFGLERYLIQEIGDPIWEITSFEVVDEPEEDEPYG